MYFCLVTDQVSQGRYPIHLLRMVCCVLWAAYCGLRIVGCVWCAACCCVCVCTCAGGRITPQEVTYHAALCQVSYIVSYLPVCVGRGRKEEPYGIGTGQQDQDVPRT